LEAKEEAFLLLQTTILVDPAIATSFLKTVYKTFFCWWEWHPLP
jgi:hypothetical protein